MSADLVRFDDERDALAAHLDRLEALLPQWQAEDLEILAAVDLGGTDKVVALLLGGTFDERTATHRGLTRAELGEIWPLSDHLLHLALANLVRLGWAENRHGRYVPGGAL